MILIVRCNSSGYTDWLQVDGPGLLYVPSTFRKKSRMDQWRPATATQLREIGQQLLDIHGQHAWRKSLTASESVQCF
jgi:hypothetical protein